MAIRVKGITITINGDATGFKRELREAKAESTILQNHLKALNKALKLDPTGITNIAAKQQVLNASIRQQRELLGSLTERAKAMEAGFDSMNEAEKRNFMSLQSQIAKTKASLMELEAEARAFGLNASPARLQWEASLSAISKDLDKVARDFLPVTAAATALGALSVYLAADYESAFAGVRKTVDATEAEFSEMYDQILEFSTKKPISASDVAYIAELGGQLGIAKDNLMEFADVIADLSVSTDLELEDAATNLAQFMNIMQDRMSYDEIDRLGATIADLGNNSATTESAIVNMALRIAGTAGNMGASAQEVMALSTTLSSLGIKAEMGGNAISTIMRNIDNQVQTSGENLETWADVWSSATGRAADEFQDAWKGDVMTTLSQVIEGLGKYKDETGSLTTLMGELDISYMRQVDTMNRLAGASDSYTKYLNMANRAWDENVALVNEAAQRYATTESKLTLMANDLKILGIRIGNDLLPYVNSFADGIGQWALSMSEMDDETRGTVEQLGLMAIAAAPTAKVLSAVGKGLDLFSAKSRNAKSAILEMATYWQFNNTETKLYGKSLEDFEKGAARAEKAAIRLKAALSIVGATAAIAAITYISERFKSMAERQEKVTRASTAMRSSMVEALGAVDKSAKGAAASVSDVGDMLERQIKVAEGMKERYRDMIGTLSVVDDAMSSIRKNMADDGTAIGGEKEYAELSNAIAILNSELGTNVQLVKDDEGNYRALADGEEIAKDKLLELISAKRDEMQLDAERENYKETLKWHKEAAEAYAANKGAIDEMHDAYRDWMDAIESGADNIPELAQKYADLYAEVGDIDTAFKSSTEALDYEKDAINFLEAAAYTATGSLERFIAESPALQAGAKASGVKLWELKQKLEEAGIGAVDLAQMTEEELIKVATSYATHIDAAVEKAEEIASIDRSVDTYTSGSHLIQNFAAGISAANNSFLARSIRETNDYLSGYLMFSVPKKGPFSGSERGGWRSGTHFIQNWAQGIEDEAPTLLGAVESVSERMASIVGAGYEMPALAGGGSRGGQTQIAGNSYSIWIDGAVVNSAPEIRDSFIGFMEELRQLNMIGGG